MTKLYEINCHYGSVFLLPLRFVQCPCQCQHAKGEIIELNPDAAARVLRAQSSSFLEKAGCRSPKKGCSQKKYFRLSSKKSAARATCNREGHELETDAAARVLRAQSSSFLKKMRGESPK
jgi:hypothetical protein